MVFNYPSSLHRRMSHKEAWEVSSKNNCLFKSYDFLRNKKELKMKFWEKQEISIPNMLYTLLEVRGRLKATRLIAGTFLNCHAFTVWSFSSSSFFSGLFFVCRWLALGVLQASSVPAVASYCGVVARINTSVHQDVPRATISIVEVIYTVV